MKQKTILPFPNEKCKTKTACKVISLRAVDFMPIFDSLFPALHYRNFQACQDVPDHCPICPESLHWQAVQCSFGVYSQVQSSRICRHILSSPICMHRRKSNVLPLKQFRMALHQVYQMKFLHPAGYSSRHLPLPQQDNPLSRTDSIDIS